MLKYFDEDAQYKLNVDSGMVESLSIAMINRGMFDHLLEYVLRLMETSTLVQFRTYEIGNLNDKN